MKQELNMPLAVLTPFTSFPKLSSMGCYSCLTTIMWLPGSDMLDRSQHHPPFYLFTPHTYLTANARLRANKNVICFCKITNQGHNFEFTETVHTFTLPSSHLHHLFIFLYFHQFSINQSVDISCLAKAFVQKSVFFFTVF